MLRSTRVPSGSVDRDVEVDGGEVATRLEIDRNAQRSGFGLFFTFSGECHEIDVLLT